MWHHHGFFPKWGKYKKYAHSYEEKNDKLHQNWEISIDFAMCPCAQRGFSCHEKNPPTIP
jgi:hypothetical protein